MTMAFSRRLNAVSIQRGFAAHSEEVWVVIAPNLSPQPTALSGSLAREDLPAGVIISGVVLPGPGGGWAPGRWAAGSCIKGTVHFIGRYHMRQVAGCGFLLATLGAIGLVMSFIGFEGGSNRAVWVALEILGDMVGSMKVASGLVLAVGIGLILIASGSEETSDPRNRG